jgi:hypothetical protein
MNGEEVKEFVYLGRTKMGFKMKLRKHSDGCEQ